MDAQPGAAQVQAQQGFTVAAQVPGSPAAKVALSLTNAAQGDRALIFAVSADAAGVAIPGATPGNVLSMTVEARPMNAPHNLTGMETEPVAAWLDAEFARIAARIELAEAMRTGDRASDDLTDRRAALGAACEDARGNGA